MRVVPKLDVPAIQYFAARAPVWQAAHAQIGLTEAQAAEVAELAAAAEAARHAQRQAQDAARAATLAYHQAVARLRAAGSACLAQIRATAATADGGGEGAGGEGGAGAVYVAAQVPPPEKPGRLPAPGQPSALSAQLRGNTGVVRLQWRFTSPGPGTVYEVRRRDGRAGHGAVAPPGPGPVVAVTGVKQFDDDTIPAGTPWVEYTVTPLRSTRRGQPATHTVHFGTSGGAAPAITYQPAAA